MRDAIRAANQNLNAAEQVRGSGSSTHLAARHGRADPTMKLRRKPIAEAQAAEIESLYDRRAASVYDVEAR